MLKNHLQSANLGFSIHCKAKRMIFVSVCDRGRCHQKVALTLPMYGRRFWVDANTFNICKKRTVQTIDKFVK